MAHPRTLTHRSRSLEGRISIALCEIGSGCRQGSSKNKIEMKGNCERAS